MLNFREGSGILWPIERKCPCETILVVTTKLRMNLVGKDPNDLAMHNLTAGALAYKNEHKIGHLRIVSVGSS